MFQRSRTLLAIAASVLITVAAVETCAGERAHRQRVVKRINIHNSVRIVDRSKFTVNLDRYRHRHRIHRETNTYSGDVAVYYRRGVGSWSYGSVSAPAGELAIQPSAKIIDVEKLGPTGACSMENGVCVVRP